MFSLAIYFFLFPSFCFSFTTFSMQANANSTTCFREFYPEKESIAIHFEITEIPLQNIPQEFHESLKSNPIKALISHNFYDAKMHSIGAIHSSSQDVFTHTTLNRDIISVCVNNKAFFDIIIQYNITLNVLNNDQERIPNKDHLKLYETELIKIEGLTEQMISENNLVLMKTRARQFTSSAILDSTSQFASYAIAFILSIRALQIWYLKNKLRNKKIL